MSYEEEFDRIMREKADGLEYQFEEGHWQKARQLITDSRRGRKGLLRSLAFTLGIIAIGSLGTMMLLTSEAEPLGSRDQYTSGDQFGDHAAGTAALAQKPVAATDEIRPAPAEKTGPAGNKAERVIRPRHMAAAATVTQEKQPESTTLSEKNARVAEPSASPGKMNLSFTGVAAGDQEESAGEDEHQASVSGGPAAPDADPAFVFLQDKRGTLFYQQLHPDAKLAAVAAVKKKDDDYFEKNSARNTLFLEAVAGGAFFTGWQASDRYDGRGFNGFAGLNGGLYLGKKWQLSTGIQVFNLGHLDEPFYSVESKSYGFSSVTSSTVISTSQLYYFAMPLKVSRLFESGGRASFGIAGAQLFRSDNEIKANTIRDKAVTSSVVSKNHSLYEGMNQQLLMLTAGYDMKLTPRLSAGVEVVYGLTDLFTANTYLRRSERPVMIRAGIIYSIADRK